MRHLGSIMKKPRKELLFGFELCKTYVESMTLFLTYRIPVCLAMIELRDRPRQSIQAFRWIETKANLIGLKSKLRLHFWRERNGCRSGTRHRPETSEKQADVFRLCCQGAGEQAV